jgi:hypothetical protein
MPEEKNLEVLKKYRESFFNNNTNEHEQKQWDEILKHHASLQEYTKELIDFISGKDLDVRQSIENLINSLLQINTTMNYYKNSMQIAPNQNPDKYIKEYIAQTEEVLSKQISLAKQLILDSFKNSAGKSMSPDEADHATSLMRMFNLMLKVHSQIRAASTKSIEPKVQDDQNIHLDKSALTPKKHSRRKYNKILEQVKEFESELETTLHSLADAKTLGDGKNQITEMINKVNKIIKQTDAQSRMEDKPKYKLAFLKLRDLFTERLESLNKLEELYSEELKNLKEINPTSLVDRKNIEEINSLQYSSSNTLRNKTSNDQFTPTTIKAGSQASPITDNKKADSPSHRLSPRPNR